jgi:hypothetical protein
MTSFRTFSAAAVLVALLTACAQPLTRPGGPEGHGPMGDRMATRDQHGQAIREMHEKMSRANTPQERQALMAEHRKLMHDGMNMMGGMHGMGMMGGDPARCQQMMHRTDPPGPAAR